MLATILGVVMVACTGVSGRPEGAPTVVTTGSVDPSVAERSAEVARDEAARAAAAEQSRLAQASAAAASAASVSSAASASAAAEAARVAAEQQAAADQARQQAEQEAAASAAAEAERVAAEQAAAEQAAAEQAAADEAQRRAADDQAQFDAALASGQCTDAPADRVSECVGLAEDSLPPPDDAGADGAAADDGSGGWYDGRGWVSPETAQRAMAAGIPVGGDVPNYLRCGTLCGESPTSGEIQSEWAQQQGLLDENGAPVDNGG